MSVLTHFAFTSLGQSALTSNLDVMLRILGLGTIGLGFLLAFLAFRLLNREQNIKAPPEAYFEHGPMWWPTFTSACA